MSLRTKLLLVLLLVTASAFAQQTILMGTYTGSQSATLCNGPITYDGVDGYGVASLIYPSTPPIAGTNYITYVSGEGGVGATTYDATCVGQWAGATATVSVMGDDSVVLSINGTKIVTASPYDTLATAKVPAGVLVNGANSVDTVVTNNDWITGVDFLVTITVPPPPPPIVFNFSVTGAVNVGLADLAPGSTICYTDNPSITPATTPDGTGCAAGNQFSAPFPITDSHTYYAIAGGPGKADSPVATATYTVHPAAAPATTTK